MTKSELKALIRECIEESVLEEAASEELVVENTELEECYKEFVNEGLYYVTEAKFSFMPKFTKNPETKALWKDIKKAESVLNSEGTPSKSGLTTALDVALSILHIFNGINSSLSLVLCITIVGIPIHLVQRAVGWAIELGEEGLAKSRAEKVIAELQKSIDNCKDPEKKKALEAKKQAMVKSIEKINNAED